MTPKQIVRGGSWLVLTPGMTQANLRCHTVPTATHTQGFRTFRPSRLRVATVPPQ